MARPRPHGHPDLLVSSTQRQYFKTGVLGCARKDYGTTDILHSIETFQGWTLFFSQHYDHPYMAGVGQKLFLQLYPAVFAEHGVTRKGVSLLYREVRGKVEQKLAAAGPLTEETRESIRKECEERKAAMLEAWFEDIEEYLEEEDASRDHLLRIWQPVEGLEPRRWDPLYTFGLVAVKEGVALVANPAIFPTLIFHERHVEMIGVTENCNCPGPVHVAERPIGDRATLMMLSKQFDYSKILSARASVYEKALAGDMSFFAASQELVDYLPSLLIDRDSEGAEGATVLVIQLLPKDERKAPAETKGEETGALKTAEPASGGGGCGEDVVLAFTDCCFSSSGD